MSFWTDNNFEPKQDHQFQIVLVRGINQNIVIPWHYVISCDKPSYQIGEKVYKLINTQKKYPGNITWSDINIELVDTVDNQAFQWINYITLGRSEANNELNKKSCGYDDFYDSNSKQNISQFNIIINSLNKEGQVIESWVLKNPWIKASKQSQLNYGSENISKITLTISYDNAIIDQDITVDPSNLDELLTRLLNEEILILDDGFDENRPNLEVPNRELLPDEEVPSGFYYTRGRTTDFDSLG